MKKTFKTLATLLWLALISLSFTSCEDEMIASTLEGTWEGNMYISSEWEGRVYDATYTEIEFLLDPFRYTKGSGYWVDHYRGDAPWQYIACHIDWRVDNGCITVHFREEGTTIRIEDYRLDDNRFSGYIYENGNRISFSLRHTSSPNWEYEYNRWGYDDWSYGWSKPVNIDVTRSSDSTEYIPSISSDSTTSEKDSPSEGSSKPKRIVRIR